MKLSTWLRVDMLAVPMHERVTWLARVAGGVFLIGLMCGCAAPDWGVVKCSELGAHVVWRPLSDGTSRAVGICVFADGSECVEWGFFRGECGPVGNGEGAQPVSAPTYVHGELGVGLVAPAEIESFAAEMIDRFGPLPAEVENLLETIAIKRLCLTAGVERIEAGPKGAIVAFRDNRFGRPEALVGWLQSQAGTVKLRPDHRLVSARAWASRAIPPPLQNPSNEPRLP